MENLADVVWRILLQKNIVEKYEMWFADAMPRPRREYLLDGETWDHLLVAIQEAVAQLRSQVVKDAEAPAISE